MNEPMNREQRRAVQRFHRTQYGKRRIERAKRAPMLVAAGLVLSPLENIIDQIERDGTVNTGANGEPIFQDGEGQWYDTCAALEGLLWHFDMYCTRHKAALPLDSLRTLYRCLHFMMPVTEVHLSNLRAHLPVLRRVMAFSDPDDALDILQQAKIKEALEQTL